MSEREIEQPVAGWLAELIDRLNDISVSQIPVANFAVVDALDAITDEMRERLGAAAADSADAPLAPKTAFAPAHGSESARRLVLAYCQGRREVIEATIASERLAGNAVKEQAERTALVEIEGIHTWVVRGGLTQNS